MISITPLTLKDYKESFKKFIDSIDSKLPKQNATTHFFKVCSSSAKDDLQFLNTEQLAKIKKLFRTGDVGLVTVVTENNKAMYVQVNNLTMHVYDCLLDNSKYSKLAEV